MANYANYKEIEYRIRFREPFKHGKSMSGKRSGNGVYYTIWSYNTIIYQEDMQTGQYWFNEIKYSNTTSRQQSIISRVLGSQWAWSESGIGKMIRVHHPLLPGSGSNPMPYQSGM